MIQYLNIDRRSGVPIYVQLSERIRLLVREGRIKPGESMPTVRTLAVELGVNANTVARVYRDLQADGVLVLERGIGTRIAETAQAPVPRADLRQIEKKVVELIHLAQQAGMTPVEIAQFIETRWQENQHVSR